MDEQGQGDTTTGAKTGSNVNEPLPDVDEGLHVGFIVPGDDEAVQLETHSRAHRHDTGHVDLRQEEYTPEEVARMLGTSLDVVMHAIWHGNLKATRKGRDVVCITHEEVTDWLRRRGQGV